MQACPVINASWVTAGLVKRGACVASDAGNRSTGERRIKPEHAELLCAGVSRSQPESAAASPAAAYLQMSAPADAALRALAGGLARERDLPTSGGRLGVKYGRQR